MKYIKNILIFLFLALVINGCGGGGGGGGGPVNSSSCTAASVANLEVTSITPAITDNDVSLNTSVSVTFNTCIDTSTVTSSSFFITGGGVPLSGSNDFDGSTYTLTFTPSTPLSYDSAYLIFIQTGLKGSNGETLTATYSSSFFTRAAPDTTPPITTASTLGGSYNTIQSITLSCDDGVGGTGCNNTYYTTDGSTPTTASTIYSTPVVISSDTTLRYFSTDVDANAETVQTQQYIIDITPPQVTSVTPINTSTNIVVTTGITATFSEDIDVATLTSSNITVDNGVTGEISYDNSTFTMTFIPNERLACNILHTVTIGTGVSDLAANNLQSNYSWSFTTHTDCDAPVMSSDLADGVYTAAQNVTLSCNDNGGSGCAKIIYTTDGTTPTLSPLNGTLVLSAASTNSISIPLGDTELQYFAEDNAGNRDVLRKQYYSISTSGFTYVASNVGLLRGVGNVPTSFVTKTTDGEVNKFFQDASNNRLYKATDRGVYSSDDDGTSWKELRVWWTENSSYQNVNGVYAKGNKIYAATRNGIFISTDSGATFEKRHPTGTNTVWCSDVIAVDINVYAACSGSIPSTEGFAISTDKGQTFSVGALARGIGSVYTNSVFVDGGTLYVGTNSGLSISTDNGVTFTNKTNVSNGLGNDTVNDVVVATGTIYAATDGGLSISSDGGNTFTNKISTDGLYNNTIEAVTVNGTSVYASSAGNGISISTDGGNSFTSTALSTNTSPATNDIIIRGSKILVGSYPTYYESTDNGTTFNHIGLPEGFIDDVVIASDKTIYVLVEASAGFTSLGVSIDGGVSFKITDYDDWGSFSSGISDLSIADTTLYIAGAGLIKTADAGANFTYYDSSDGLSSNSSGSVFATSNDTVYINSGNFIDVSTNAGGIFSQLVNSGSGGGPSGMFVSGSNIFMSTSSGLQVSNDGGTSFSLKTSADGIPSSYVTGVVAHSGGSVFVTTLNNGVGISSDNGASFNFLTDGNRVSVCNDILYVGDSGLKISTDEGASFTRVLTFDQWTHVEAACFMP